MKILIGLFLLFTFSVQAKTLSENYIQFQNLVEKTNTWRDDAIGFLIDFQRDSGKVISSKDLSLIHESAKDYKAIRDEFYSIINDIRHISKIPYKDVSFKQNGITRAEGEQNSFFFDLIKNGGNIFGVWVDRMKSKPTLNIDICTEAGRDFVIRFKMAFSSALILYDNYRLVMDQIEELERQDKLKMILNYDNDEMKNFLTEIEKEYSSIENYRSIRNTLKIYELINDEIEFKELEKGEVEQYIDSTINSSYFYSIRDEISLASVWKRRKDLAIKWIKQKFSYSKSKTTSRISKAFGNTIGLVATRKGKLLEQSRTKFLQLTSKLKKLLKPMDVLLEKTPFRLTDKFIPGHWGHAAIWLGSKEELIESGHWNQLSEEVQKEVEKGNNVLEALRPGVEINPLEHFLNVDDLAILRPNFIKTSEDLSYHLERSEEQFGKEYDFNFDVETDLKIVCSELIYVVYNQEELTWPLEKTLGRNTISPDHVAEKATLNAIQSSEFSFTPISLYLDGKEIEEQNIQSEFEALLNY